MNTFITLPTGTRINTAHLIHYKQSEHESQIQLVLTDEPTPWLETMTVEEMDALLSPPSSPIIESVVNLDKLKPGAGCQFTYEGQVKHGVIEAILIGEDENKEVPYISISSSGRSLSLYLSDHEIVDITEFQKTDT